MNKAEIKHRFPGLCFHRPTEEQVLAEVRALLGEAADFRSGPLANGAQLSLREVKKKIAEAAAPHFATAKLHRQAHSSLGAALEKLETLAKKSEKARENPFVHTSVVDLVLQDAENEVTRLRKIVSDTNLDLLPGLQALHQD